MVIIMRIGIVTFTFGDNFGQRLQNYALQEYLKKYADCVMTIPQFEPPKSLRNKYRFVKNAIIHPKHTYYDWKRHQKFLNFDRDYIQYYCCQISDNSIPAKIDDDFDFFVCGSDQIWSPYSPFVNKTMFLTFTEKNKRISYAASIASNQIPSEKREQYSSYWRGFNEISIRENTLRDYIERSSGVKANVHVDPTLLHDWRFWSKIMHEPGFQIEKEYVLCYFLGSIEQRDKVLSKFNLEAFDVVDIMNDKKYYSISPAEFLWLIFNSKFVITDSYHGTLFSLIFHKPYVIVNRLGTEIDMNSRFETLTELLMLKNRNSDSLKASELYDIDFDFIDSRIAKEQTVTARYFSKYLRRIER